MIRSNCSGLHRWGSSLLTCIAFFVYAGSHVATHADTYYVDASRPDDSGAATNWATAKQTIQAAVDLAVDGDMVLVTNGVYDSGGMATPGYLLTNRVYIAAAVEVRSMNGPDVTMIAGAAGSNGGNDVDSVRGVLMQGSAKLIGFTVTNGHTMASGSYEYDRPCGGIWMTGNSVVDRCVITGNRSSTFAGGVLLNDGGTIRNSLIVDNTAVTGGGVQFLETRGTANNCTFSRNYASSWGGGVAFGGGGMSINGGTLLNSIVWGNSAGGSAANLYRGNDGVMTIAYTCAPEGMTNGMDGCTTNNPLFLDAAAGLFKLKRTSPCYNTGNVNYVPADSLYDLSGYPRITGGLMDMVDMGAYQHPFMFVDANAGNDTNDGLTWSTAKESIQAAVDNRVADAVVVWVTNGVYDTGGAVTPGYSLTNRVCVTNAIELRSVNGPEHTIISGTPGSNGSNDVDSVRGVFLSGGARLTGFTITNGYTMETEDYTYNRIGGGVWLTDTSVVDQCIIAGNMAWAHGGGVLLEAGGTINNSLIVGNTVQWNSSGGIMIHDAGGTANNCTVYGNYAAQRGGGVTLWDGGTMNNCIVWSNRAGIAGNDLYKTASHLSALYTCASSGVSNGVDGCTTNDPNLAGAPWGDYRICYPSSCINSGDNAYAPTNESPYDLAENPRINDGTVDMGAYEYRYTNLYVDASRPDDSGDGTTWSTAKKSIQSAVDLMAEGGTVLVTNGVYDTGGAVTPGYSLSNRVCLVGAIELRSVNGPEHTIISGSAGSNGGNDVDSVRGVFMQRGAKLVGFTVTNGHTMATGDLGYDQYGGGVWLTDSCVVDRCVISGSKAYHYAGGVLLSGGGTINNSLITGNTAVNSAGGGILLNGVGGTANNCTLAGNSAGVSGGGAAFWQGGTMNNCVVWSNSAGTTGNDIHRQNDGMTIRNTCASDGVTYGVDGCIVGNPQFLDAATGIFRVLGSSPCITAGNTNYVSPNSLYDLAGYPRISCGKVDMGAYQHHSLYVDANMGSDTNDGLSWSTAKETIQGAVDHAAPGMIVWVTNGVYDSGGGPLPGYALTNRVCVTNAIAVRSVNGPEVTIIAGAPGANGSNDVDSVRGVFLSGNAALSGFTITNGSTMVTGNYIYDVNGGGVWMSDSAVLDRCVIAGNMAYSLGGGVYMDSGGTLNNSLIVGNTVEQSSGGGVSVKSAGSVNNCTVYGNHASLFGGGVALSTGGEVNNCIVWSNTAEEGYANLFKNYGIPIRYTCAPDGITHGVDGCITGDPNLAGAASGDYRLYSSTPCLDAGYNLYAPDSAYDLARNTRIVGKSVDMGAYEISYTNLYVDASRPDDSGDGLTWASAKKTIQAAVNNVVAGFGVCVTNGRYTEGGVAGTDTQTNRVYVTNSIAIYSVNGPEHTVIEGAPGSNGSNSADSVRGVYLSGGAKLTGFTISNGYTMASGPYGAGVWLSDSCVVERCVITGNTSDRYGGGACLTSGGTLNNCLITGNESVNNSGGGVILLDPGGTLNNCTLYGNNSGENGGGVICWAGGTMNNCIAWSNSAAGSGNDIYIYNTASIQYSCASDLTDGTDGCTTNDPQFVFMPDLDYYLQPLSPCVNSGNNTSAPTNDSPYDLADRDRIINVIVDMGCYEMPTNVYLYATTDGPGHLSGDLSGWYPTNVIASITPAADSYYMFTNWTGDLSGETPDSNPLNLQMDQYRSVTAYFTALVTTNTQTPHWWLAEYGWTNAFEDAALTDPDGDDFPTWQEYIADTDPTNSASFFHVAAFSNNSPVTVYFESSTNRIYSMDHCSNLVDGIWTVVPDITPRPGVGMMDSMQDTNLASQASYRITVELP